VTAWSTGRCGRERSAGEAIEVGGARAFEGGAGRIVGVDIADAVQDEEDQFAVGFLGERGEEVDVGSHGGIRAV
jgi:hypothetical protein